MSQVLQKNRWIQREINKRRITMRNWLTQLWGPGSPTICDEKAGDPGKLVVSFSPSQKTLRPEAPMSVGRRRQKSHLKKRKIIRPSSAFLFCSSPQRIGCYPHTLVGWIFFTHSTDPNANLFQKYPPRHTQKSCFTASVEIAYPSQVDIEK